MAAAAAAQASPAPAGPATPAQGSALIAAPLSQPVHYGLAPARRDMMTPDQVIAMMQEGNARFRSGQRMNRDFLAEQAEGVAGQWPVAVILSCMDSRVPAEIVMDLGIGDVFNTRLAGNVIDGDVLGSLEFACAQVGSKVVVVMGHTSCGAVKGAIDQVELGNLTRLLYKIRPAITATVMPGERTSRNLAFVDAVGRKNVELTVAAIRQQSPILAGLETRGAIRIVGAMYDLGTGAVEFLP